MKNEKPLSQGLMSDLFSIIQQGKHRAAAQVNSTLVLVYWQVGKRINEDILNNERAAYGKEVIAGVAERLVKEFGKGFQARNLRRMMRFASEFSDAKIVSTLSTQLSWSHFVELIPLKTQDAKSYYATKIAEEQWSVRETRRQIERKAYERNQIAASQMADSDVEHFSFFKDPYFLDFLDLKDSYHEKDLEAAILRDLEFFILELGMGFSFVERQKRMIIDGDDFYLDLLFYHRKLKRLVAVELKLGKFKAADKGQMELYLAWLDRYEKEEGENKPIGLILCPEASRQQVELLKMHKDGIMVAEYWTNLPSKEDLEHRLQKALKEARERLARGQLDQ